MRSQRFHTYVDKVSAILDKQLGEHETLMLVGKEARTLVQRDDWLPDELAVPHPVYYQQYLLYLDPHERFSVVSFVWGPGQKTPVHDHQTWGVIGMLRGAEVGDRYIYDSCSVRQTSSATLRAGEIELVSPSIGDIHRVANASDTKVSISIHTYGGNIGTISRHVFDAATGERKAFVSGYANAGTAAPGYAPQLQPCEAGA